MSRVVLAVLLTIVMVALHGCGVCEVTKEVDGEDQTCTVTDSGLSGTCCDHIKGLGAYSDLSNTMSLSLAER